MARKTHILAHLGVCVGDKIADDLDRNQVLLHVANGEETYLVSGNAIHERLLDTITRNGADYEIGKS